MAKIINLSNYMSSELDECLDVFGSCVVVLCHGIFDFFHAGHLAYLKEARSFGDYLVVSITNDECVRKQRGADKPVYGEHIRAEMLAALDIVDLVIINDSNTAESVISLVKPRFFVKGMEYRDSLAENIPLLKEKKMVEAHGGELVFAQSPKMSSAKLLNENFPIYSEATKKFLAEFKKTHEKQKILDLLEEMEKLKVLVIGDSILDVHIYVNLLDKAPKTGILAMGYQDHEIMYGASALIAKTAAQFAGHITMTSIVGNKAVPTVIPNNNFTLMTQDFSQYPNITHKLIIDDEREPTIKVRYREGVFEELKHRTTIAEIVHQPLKFPRKEIMDQAMNINYRSFDLVICMDYGQYMIPSEWANDIAYESPFLCLACQSNESNYGFNSIFRYPRAHMLCIDDVELRLAFSDKDTDLPVLMGGARRQLQSKLMVLTRGRLGCSVLIDQPGKHLFDIPVLGSGEIVDRIGAGDSFIVMASLAARVTSDPEIIGFFGNIGGYLKCLMEGTGQSITKEDVSLFIKRVLT